MTALGLWELAGWACAAGAMGVLAVVRRRMGEQMALVAEASHELRGPLAAVRLGLATLLRDAEPERARRAAALEIELQRAGLALEDLAVAPARRRAGDTLGPVDVADLLDEAGDAWGSVAAALGRAIEVEAPTEWWVVRADRVRLVQALSNLVANALEHGQGPVRLRARRAGDRVRFEVVDSGRGLTAPLPETAGHTARRGHGLAVATRVAERCGGRLSSERVHGRHVMALALPVAGAGR